MKVVLELQDQPSNVRRITVRHDIVIGRGSDCNLRLSAPQVSRRHCFLRVGRDSVSVTDLDSSNGTYVDGARITAGKRYEIADGAQLALGPIRFIIHMRAEAAVADSAKLKIAAGVSNEALRGEAGRDSVPQRSSTVEGSAAPRRPRTADSDVPMDYSMEQGGDSAEPHEPTQDNLGGQHAASGSAEFMSPGPDLMDSRLEIIDFGRRISEESPSADDASAAPQSNDTNKSAKADDEEPQWESAIIDSSEFSDDLDVLSISENSGVNNEGNREHIMDAESPTAAAAADDCLAIDDSIETVYPQPYSDSNVTVHEQTYVVADEFLDVDVADDVLDELFNADDIECADVEVDEILEVADEVLEEDGETHWFADDAEEVIDELVNSTDEASGEPVQSAEDDEIDPDLQNFLKGF